MRRTVPAVMLTCIVTVTSLTHAHVVARNSPAPQTIDTIAVPVLDMDLSKAPIVRPTAVDATGDPRTLKRLREQFGIPQPTQGYSIHLSENPNLAYRKVCPFPKIEWEGLVPSEPNGRDVTHLGLKRIAATTRHWVWPPRDQATAMKPVIQTLWHWDVPASLQSMLFSAAYGEGADRYWALCLYPERDAKIPGIPVETRLFYFDTLTGLKWQATIPVRQLLPPASPADGYAETTVKLGITSDGNRVLVLVSRRDKIISLLYVFDGKGTLLKTTQFLGYTAQQSGLLSWQLMRSSTGQTHVLTLRYHFDSFKDVSFLVDADGNIVTRFGDEEGKPVQIMQVTDKYAVAQRRQSDGHVAQYILQLP